MTKVCAKCGVEKGVRGLLCHHCNVALGSLNDDPVLLQKAVLYLNGAPT